MNPEYRQVIEYEIAIFTEPLFRTEKASWGSDMS